MFLDIGVVVIYMGAMLLLGWYGMRRAKTQEDFLVAGRNLGPGFYMGTMAATVLGGPAPSARAPGLCPRHLRLLAVRGAGRGHRGAEPVLAKPLLAAHTP